MGRPAVRPLFSNRVLLNVEIAIDPVVCSMLPDKPPKGSNVVRFYTAERGQRVVVEIRHCVSTQPQQTCSPDPSFRMWHQLPASVRIIDQGRLVKVPEPYIRITGYGENSSTFLERTKHESSFLITAVNRLCSFKACNT